MPFLKGGRQAVTRTKQYLDSGRLILNDSVKVIAIHHVPDKEISRGCDELIKWFLPPIQFKNPHVQVYLENREELLIDTSFRKASEIHDHMKAILSKSAHPITSNVDSKPEKNLANLGLKCIVGASETTDSNLYTVWEGRSNRPRIESPRQVQPWTETLECTTSPPIHYTMRMCTLSNRPELVTNHRLRWFRNRLFSIFPTGNDNLVVNEYFYLSKVDRLSG